MYRSLSQLHFLACSRRSDQPGQRRAHRRGYRRGFTLLEASLATVIVGVAFVAVLQLLAAGTISNMDSSQQTTAVNLARNVRELLLQKSYASLPTYNNVTYTPPRDSTGANITEMSEWKQTVTVQAVDQNEVTTNIVDSTPVALRITVTVSRNDEKVCDLSWYSFDGRP